MESFKIFNGKKKVEVLNEMVNAKEAPFSELEDESSNTTVEGLHDLIDYLDEIDYDNIADIILDYLDIHYEDETGLGEGEFYEGEELAEDEMEDDSKEDEEEMDEKMKTKFTGKKKGVRKFKLTKAKLRQGKKKNKAQLRKGRVKGRIARKKNKIKIKKYQASRNKAIKSGQHVSKKHRGK